MGVHPHSIWAQLQPRLTRWLQLGLQLAPSQDGQSWGAARAQAGPNPGQFCGLSATRWKLAFLPLVPTFFCFGRGFKAMLPTLIGPQVGPKCSAQLKSQGRPSLPPVGFGWAKCARLVFFLSNSLGAGGSCREAIRINHNIMICDNKQSNTMIFYYIENYYTIICWYNI